MSIIIKKNSLYRKILTSMLILSYSILSYAQQQESPDTSPDDLVFEYVDNKFNPFEVASKYIKFSATPNIYYFDIGMQVPAYQYMSYTLGINFFNHLDHPDQIRESLKIALIKNIRDYDDLAALSDPTVINQIIDQRMPTNPIGKFLIKFLNNKFMGFNAAFGIKFKFPFEILNMHIAPYTHLTIGPAMICDTNSLASGTPEFRFAMSKTVSFGVDAYVNEWIGIFAEMQIKDYSYPAKSITYKRWDHDGTSEILNFNKTKYRINNLFVVGLQTTF